METWGLRSHFVKIKCSILQGHKIFFFTNENSQIDEEIEPNELAHTLKHEATFHDLEH